MKKLLLPLLIISATILHAQDFKLEKQKTKMDIFKNASLVFISLTGGCCIAGQLANLSDKIEVPKSKPWRGVAQSLIRGSSMGTFLAGFWINRTQCWSSNRFLS